MVPGSPSSFEEAVEALFPDLAGVENIQKKNPLLLLRFEPR